MTQLYRDAHWKGSEKTRDQVKEQIVERWGEEEAENYDPEKNCFTFNTWWALGYCVKKGEHALRSYTLVEETVQDETKTKQAIKKYPKNVYLFYYLQVEKRK